MILQSDNPDTEKVHSDTENQSTQGGKTVRDYISSPGYDTSSSNAPTSSPDPCEYTYEGAIQDYKSRVLRASSNTFIAENGAMAANATVTSIVSSIKAETIQLPKAKSSTGDIEYLLNAFAIHESTSNTGNDRNGDSGVDKKNLPKIDILKRRAIFEKESAAARKSFETTSNKAMEELSTKISIKERVSSLENREEVTDAAVKKRLSGEFNRVKNRLSNIESPIVNSIAVEDKPPKIDVPVAPLKDRLFSLQSAAFEERSRDPPKKIDLLGDQRLIGLDKMNGNHDYQLETESELKTSTNYNIYTQEYAQHNIAVQSSGAPLTSFDDLLPDDSDLQLNAYEQLEVIQEEREEQQLQQQYNMSVQIPAKKPEVMPRTTRNITPDPQQKAAERIANVSLDDLQEQDENNSDLNDDGDFRDDSVSVTNALNHHKDINNLANVSSEIDCSETVVVINESTTNGNVDRASKCSSTINVLILQELEPHKQLTISHNSILDSNHNVELDKKSTIVESFNIALNQIQEIHSSPEPTESVPVFSAVTEKSENVRFAKSETKNTENNSCGIDVAQTKESESVMSKNQRIKCQIVDVLEKKKKPAKTMAPEPIVHNSLQTKLPSPKSPSKTKNIFEFIKRNLLNETTSDAVADDPAELCSSNSKDKIENGPNNVEFSVDKLLDEEIDKLSDDERR